MSKKTIILLALGALAFLQGIQGQYFYPGATLPATDIWLMPVGIFLIFWWFTLDARQRDYRRKPLLNVAVIILAILALPYYFFRSRGLKHGLAATGLFVLAWVASGVITTAGQYTAYYGLQS